MGDVLKEQYTKKNGINMEKTNSNRPIPQGCRISIPIMDKKDLLELDNILDTYSDTIIKQITEVVLHEKDLIIMQKIIEKQQAEIEKKNKIIEQMAKDRMLKEGCRWMNNIFTYQDVIKFYEKFVEEENK